LHGTCCEGVETNHFALISSFYEILSFDVAVQIFIYLPLFLVSLSCVICVCQAHGNTRTEPVVDAARARALGPSGTARDVGAGRDKRWGRSVTPHTPVEEEVTPQGTWVRSRAARSYCAEEVV
jgi:hypothetical protein